MRSKPQFRLVDKEATGSGVVLVISEPMRLTLSRLLSGLLDADIKRLAGPVASPVKAFAEVLAKCRSAPGDPVVVA